MDSGGDHKLLLLRELRHRGGGGGEGGTGGDILHPGEENTGNQSEARIQVNYSLSIFFRILELRQGQRTLFRRKMGKKIYFIIDYLLFVHVLLYFERFVKISHCIVIITRQSIDLCM